MYPEFLLNISEEQIKYFEIELEKNKCKVTLGILGENLETIEKEFDRNDDAEEYFNHEIATKLKEKYFKTLGGAVTLDKVQKEENIGFIIKESADNFYTYVYLEEFKVGAIILLEVENDLITERSKRIFKDLTTNQSEYKWKINKSIFDFHKESFEQYMEHCGINGVKEDFEDFQRNYATIGWSIEKYIDEQITKYREMMKGWRDILNAEDYSDKQVILSKEIELTRIEIL